MREFNVKKKQRSIYIKPLPLVLTSIRFFHFTIYINFFTTRILLFLSEHQHPLRVIIEINLEINYRRTHSSRRIKNIQIKQKNYHSYIIKTIQRHIQATQCQFACASVTLFPFLPLTFFKHLKQSMKVQGYFSCGRGFVFCY